MMQARVNIRNYLFLLTSKLTYTHLILIWSFTAVIFTHSSFLHSSDSPVSPDLIIGIYWVYLLMCCGGFVLYKIKENNDFTFVFDRYTVLVFSYFGTGLLSVLANTSHFSQSVFFLLTSFLSAVIGLIYIQVISPAETKKILHLIFWFGVINAAVSLLLFAYNGFAMSTTLNTAVSFTDRNLLSRYLCVVNVFVLIELCKGFQSRVIRKRYVIAWVLISLCIITQLSRSGYALYLFSTAMVLFSYPGKRVKVITVISIIVFGLLFAFLISIRIKQDRMDVANYTDLQRVALLKGGYNMIKDSPLTGIGYKMSQFRYQEYADKNLPGIQGVTVIHNIYVSVWAEQGVIGLIIFIVLNFSLIIKNYLLFRKNNFYQGSLPLFCSVSLLLFMIHGLVYHDFDYEGFYWIIIALSIISLENNTDTYDQNVSAGLSKYR